MTEQDEKILQIQSAIAELERAKEKRLAELSDPRRVKVRKLWEEVQRAVAALEDAGECLENSYGEALEIIGNTFSLDPSGELIEH